MIKAPRPGAGAERKEMGPEIKCVCLDGSANREGAFSAVGI